MRWRQAGGEDDRDSMWHCRSFHARAEHRELLAQLYELHALESEGPGSFSGVINLNKARLKRHDVRCYRGAAVHSRCRLFLTAEHRTRRSLEVEHLYVSFKIINEIGYNAVSYSDIEGIVIAFESYCQLIFARSAIFPRGSRVST